MKPFKQIKKEIFESVLLGKTVQMGDRRGRIITVVSVGETRTDSVYKVKFRDGSKVEMHDSQIRPFLVHEEHGAGEEGTDELVDTYREDTPGEVEEGRIKDFFSDTRKKINIKGWKAEIRKVAQGIELVAFHPKTSIEEFIMSGHVNAKIDMMRLAAEYGLVLVGESVELDEAWTADSVIKNAEIGSKKGYGINIKKGGGVTKTPFKHMLLTTRKHGNVRVTFDHGKGEFEGTPQSVAIHINQTLGIKESVELDERRKDVYAIVDKKGKVVAANLTRDNSGKESSNRGGQRKGFTIVLDPDAKVGDVLKTFASESVEEEAPANSVGGGMSPHFGGEGGIKGYDPLLGKKVKKRKKFAGAEVFELSSDEYYTCMHGRKRYERWNKRLNMENIDNQEIRDYAHKNPGVPIVIQDKTTGIMAYLIHGERK